MQEKNNGIRFGTGVGEGMNWGRGGNMERQEDGNSIFIERVSSTPLMMKQQNQPAVLEAYFRDVKPKFETTKKLKEPGTSWKFFFIKTRNGKMMELKKIVFVFPISITLKPQHFSVFMVVFSTDLY